MTMLFSCLNSKGDNVIVPRCYPAGLAGLVILLAWVFIGCSTKKKYGPAKKPAACYPMDARFRKGKDFDPKFGTHMVRLDSTNFVVFLDNNGQLHYNSLPPGAVQSFVFDLSAYIKGLRWYSARFSGTDLYILDVSDRVLKQFVLRENQYYPGIVCPMNKLFNWNPYSIGAMYNNTIEVQYPFVYIPYNIHSQTTNFLDTAKYFRIRFTDSITGIKSGIKTLFSPVSYVSGKERLTFSSLIKINDTLFFYGFAGSDSVFHYNPVTNTVTAAGRFETCGDFRVFNHSKEYNLYYLKWYDETNESNIRFLTCPDGSALVIKKSRKSKIKDPNIFEYYFLDRDLKVLYHEVFSHTINPQFSFATESGYWIFDGDLANAWYYEN